MMLEPGNSITGMLVQIHYEPSKNYLLLVVSLLWVHHNHELVNIQSVVTHTPIVYSRGNDDGQKQRLRRDVTHVTSVAWEKGVGKVRRP